VLERDEVNGGLIGIVDTGRSSLVYLFERICVVNQSKVHQWWYVPKIPVLFSVLLSFLGDG
jgi:hypothetical protein